MMLARAAKTQAHTAKKNNKFRNISNEQKKATRKLTLGRLIDASQQC
jgi:hypothetical protein